MSAISSSAPGPGDVGQHEVCPVSAAGRLKRVLRKPGEAEWPGPKVNNFSASSHLLGHPRPQALALPQGVEGGPQAPGLAPGGEGGDVVHL